VDVRGKPIQPASAEQPSPGVTWLFSMSFPRSPEGGCTSALMDSYPCSSAPSCWVWKVSARHGLAQHSRRYARALTTRRPVVRELRPTSSIRGSSTSVSSAHVLLPGSGRDGRLLKHVEHAAMGPSGGAGGDDDETTLGRGAHRGPMTIIKCIRCGADRHEALSHCSACGYSPREEGAMGAGGLPRLVEWRSVVGLEHWAWGRTLNALMSEHPLPAMCGDTIYVTSDQSGHHRDSRYHVTSILAVDVDNSPAWPELRSEVRNRFIADGRRMSFKSLNDRHRRAALLPFLGAAGLLHGFCATVAIEKGIRWFITAPGVLDAYRSSVEMQGRWEVEQFEGLARLAGIVAMFVAGVVQPNQQVMWVSDQDDAFANPARSADAARLFAGFMSAFVKHPLDRLLIGTTQMDEGDRGEEDLAAIPDLLAGALAEGVTALAAQGHEGAPTLRDKTQTILGWLFRTPKRLAHIEVVVERGPDGRFIMFAFELE
jgi:hypothetical protein